MEWYNRSGEIIFFNKKNEHFLRACVYKVVLLYYGKFILKIFHTSKFILFKIHFPHKNACKIMGTDSLRILIYDYYNILFL